MDLYDDDEYLRPYQHLKTISILISQKSQHTTPSFLSLSLSHGHTFSLSLHFQILNISKGFKEHCKVI
ncbi:hypothetical protein HanXRQr2_Chr15g0716961 [Helianthus annuus]|uniref:Uncharacterized protein n=1 Tax=Helianthus annuus TaxID=4232 RepID=A0A9K3H592_HELAN|nr:hypothetical protein HanXRQr2_Chr15g0716961 [Helianthus annuus]KAJ0833230.1 hypothetical protein HanPSC8_Chr15g0687931 [Helianthus annuus]